MILFNVCFECSRLFGCVLKYDQVEEEYKCESCKSRDKHCKNHVFTPENVVLNYCKRCLTAYSGGYHGKEKRVY